MDYDLSGSEQAGDRKSNQRLIIQDSDQNLSDDR